MFAADQEGQRPDQPAWVAPRTPGAGSQETFDLDEAVESNDFFARGIRFLDEGQAAQAAAGEDGQAIYRLRNALWLYPPLLDQVHRAGERPDTAGSASRRRTPATPPPPLSSPTANGPPSPTPSWACRRPPADSCSAR